MESCQQSIDIPERERDKHLFLIANGKSSIPSPAQLKRGSTSPSPRVKTPSQKRQILWALPRGAAVLTLAVARAAISDTMDAMEAC